MRVSLRNDRAALEQDFLKQTMQRLWRHTGDRYLRHVWRQPRCPPYRAGGGGRHGRCKLYPRSDIDLLILLDAESENPGRAPPMGFAAELHRLIVCYGISAEVGHSVRTVAQCINESADITVQTNLLEARLTAATRRCSMNCAIQQHLDLRAFYLAVARAATAPRSATRRPITTRAEPEGKPGGLRDGRPSPDRTQPAPGTHWSELAQPAAHAAEARQIARHSALLATLRTRRITSRSGMKTACCSISRRCSQDNWASMPRPTAAQAST
jgi:[protein-PII] uridylyltransferase